MIPRLLNQAKMRLKLCVRAFDQLKQAHFEEDSFQTHWQDFLIQWKGAYMKLQQAAKSSPQEMQWFGRINNFRRQDPLLRRLYETRNDEEHFGLTDSAVHVPGRAIFRFTTSSNGPSNVRVTLDGDKSTLVDAKTGEVVGVLEGHSDEILYMQEVTERDGKRKVPPPTQHRGQTFEPKPQIAALLGVNWLLSVMAEAEEKNKP